MARAATSIVAADMTYVNGCFAFRWWEWGTTFFVLSPVAPGIAKVAMAKKLAVHLYWMCARVATTASCRSAVINSRGPSPLGQFA